MAQGTLDIAEIETRVPDLREALDFVQAQLKCGVTPAELSLALQAGTWLELRRLRASASFGQGYVRFNMVEIGTARTKLLDREPSGRVRKVTIIVESSAGGPLPTIRYGDQGVTQTAGARLVAGRETDAGEIPPDTELWAISTTPIDCCVIERA